MKYGMNLLLWTAGVDDSVYPVLEKIKSWGYDGVELPVFELNQEPYARMGKRLEELGLGCTGVTVCSVEANPIGPEAKTRKAGVDYLKRAVEMVAAAGGTHLCGPIHSALGHFVGRGRTEEEWKWARDSLSEAAEHAKKQNVVLVVEALNRFECYFLNSHAEAAQFCREVNHPNLKMMYDTFHAHIEEKDPAAAIEACRDQLVHVHISENDRSTPGEGQVNWKASFDALKKSGYDGWLMIEAFGLALPELAAATRIWRRMYPSEEHLAKNGLAFMKSQWEGKR